MAVPMGPDSGAGAGTPTELFRAVLYGSVFVPDPGGQRFLIARPAPSQEIVPLEIVLNPFR